MKEQNKDKIFLMYYLISSQIIHGFIEISKLITSSTLMSIYIFILIFYCSKGEDPITFKIKNKIIKITTVILILVEISYLSRVIKYDIPYIYKSFKIKNSISKDYLFYNNERIDLKLKE